MPEDNRLTELEIALAHAERTVEELSEVVREQADRVTALERRVAALSARIGVVEEGAATPPAADQRPPHW